MFMSSVAKRFSDINRALFECAAACGRAPESVRLVCVSKTATAAQVLRAYEAGARIFGENRIEVLQAKLAALPALPGAQWHFIGNIQSRKIADIVACADMIHSVWRAGHVAALDAAAAACGKVQDILIEVNVSGEASKDGLAPADVPEMLAACEAALHLRVCGLMCMAPQGDAHAAHEAFAGLAALRERLVGECPARAETLTELSMGMSEDWQAAVAAGSTMIRVGRAVFADDFAPHMIK